MTIVESLYENSQLHFEDFAIDEISHEDMAIWCTIPLKKLGFLGRNPQQESLVQFSWHHIVKRQYNGFA